MSDVSVYLQRGDASGLAVVSDLFGDEAYFADAEAFWVKQDETIQMIATGHDVLGWAQTVILERGAYFATWDHVKCSKEDGGHVFISVSHQGEVTEHEGYITSLEAKRREKAASSETGQAQPKPELTKAAQNYVDLHRHAAVRSDLLDHSAIAWRLTVAHMIAGSSLWAVEADPQRTILCDCTNGTRTPADPNWTPPHMAFPSGGYRDAAEVETEVTVSPLQDAA